MLHASLRPMTPRQIPAARMAPTVFALAAVALILRGLPPTACGQQPSPRPAAAPVAAKAKVGPVPKNLRNSLHLSPFYKKYADANGFPVLSSDKVSDAGLLEAVDIVNHMLDGRDDIRRAIIKNKVRLAVMAPDEHTTDVPEHSDLKPKAYWDRHSRSWGDAEPAGR